MLAFITSLRHPLNSTNYAQVESLLADTLASIMRQDCSAWSVWVVGNRRPRSLPAAVNWIEVDFPPPSPRAGPITGVPAVLWDKGTKLVAGFAAARQTSPDHVMLMDADDLVSRRLASLSHRQPDAPGWRVTDGWRWASQRAAVRPQPQFHQHCGTAYIVRADLFDVPARIGPRSTQREIADALGSRLDSWFGSHLHLAEELAAGGSPLEPVPFPAALYRVGTGENHSGISLGGFGRPVGAAVAQEFGIPRTRLTPAGIMKAILPSQRAVRERVTLRRRR